MMRVVLSIFAEATRAFARGERLMMVLCRVLQLREATRAFARGERYTILLQSLPKILKQLAHSREVRGNLHFKHLPVTEAPRAFARGESGV